MALSNSSGVMTITMPTPQCKCKSIPIISTKNISGDIFQDTYTVTALSISSGVMTMPMPLPWPNAVKLSIIISTKTIGGEILQELTALSISSGVITTPTPQAWSKAAGSTGGSGLCSK